MLAPVTRPVDFDPTRSTLQKLQDARAHLLMLANGPYPTDAYAQPTWETAGAHGMILEGLINIYEVSTSLQRCSHLPSE